MNQAIKQQWITALRSGKYVQGKDWLRTKTDRFCCLGVLCELAVAAKVIPKPVLDILDHGPVFRYSKGPGSATTLPSAVMHWADVGATGHYKFCSLASDNDLGKTFSEIADIIEEYF